MWSRTHSPIPLVDPEKLQFCIQNGLNVLLEGKHGVGKTTLVKKAFERAGLNLLIFSGPTMDPWVDFVGVPRPIKRKDGKTVLELVKRPEFADDRVDAIFIDEFNRAPSKVRSAALELLQFRSVNGQRFERLKSVWAAINPAKDEYDAEQLDPAQLDRFHVKIEVPYKPCPNFFITQFGGAGKAALEWWDLQGAEAQAKVSPRRLEYAVRIALIDGPVREVLPPEANVGQFLRMLQDGPFFGKLGELVANRDLEGARKVLNDPKTGSLALKHVLGSETATVFFLPLLDSEKLMSLLNNVKVLETVVKHSDSVPEFRNAVVLALHGDEKSTLFKMTRALVRRYKVSATTDSEPVLAVEEELDSKRVAAMDPYGRVAHA